MYFVKGARGIEVIPNYTFWKDFPFLLKVNMTVHVQKQYTALALTCSQLAYIHYKTVLLIVSGHRVTLTNAVASVLSQQYFCLY